MRGRERHGRKWRVACAADQPSIPQVAAAAADQPVIPQVTAAADRPLIPRSAAAAAIAPYLHAQAVSDPLLAAAVAVAAAVAPHRCDACAAEGDGCDAVSMIPQSWRRARRA